MSIELKFIAACVVSSDNIAIAQENGVKAYWFAEKENEIVFNAIEEIATEDKWTPSTLSIVFDKHNLLEKYPQINSFVDYTEDWAFDEVEFVAACECFATDYASRKVMELSRRTISQIKDGECPYSAIEDIREGLNRLDSVDASGERTAASIADSAFDIDLRVSRGEVIGLPFPWKKFQDKTFGIPYGVFCPIAGRDGKGKSRLSAYLTYYWLTQGFPMAYFPFEDGAERFMCNLAAAHGGYDLFTIRRGYASSEFMNRHKSCLEFVSKLPIHIHAKSSTAEQVAGKIRKWSRREGLKGVVIDGFKDLIATKGENRTQQENYMVQVLNGCAGDTNVPIIPIMHLNKIDVDSWITKDKITGSGKQTQSSRMALFYQDAGIPPDLLKRYETLDERLMAFDCQKASYGDEATIVLEKNLEEGRFNEPREFDSARNYTRGND